MDYYRYHLNPHECCCPWGVVFTKAAAEVATVVRSAAEIATSE